MARLDAFAFDRAVVARAPAGVRARVPAPPRPSVAVLRFALPRSTPATVAVFDGEGHCVRTLLSGELEAGEHACSWDGRDELDRLVAVGDYTLRLEADARTVTSRRVSIA